MQVALTHEKGLIQDSLLRTFMFQDEKKNKLDKSVQKILNAIREHKEISTYILIQTGFAKIKCYTP